MSVRLGQPIRNGLCTGALLALTTVGLSNPVGAQSQSAKSSGDPSGNSALTGWEFVVVPYALLPSIDGDATLGRVGAPVEVNPGDILDALNLGGMIHTEARHKSGFGFTLDYSFMDLGKGATSDVGSIDADIYQGIFEGYGTYRFQVDDNLFDAYAGVRVWDIDVDVDIKQGLSAGTLSNGETWVDPVIGMRWQRPIAQKWRVLAQGDIGGFGIGGASDFSWNLMGGIAYDAWENTSLFLMYRALAVDYETGTPGTPTFFAYDTITHGPLLGVGIRF